MKKMRDLMEAVAPLTESEGRFTPAINAALDHIEAGFEALQEAAEAEMGRMTAELSLQWPGCVVATYIGHGMPSCKVLPTDEMIARADQDDRYSEELGQALNNLDDSDTNPILGLAMEIDQEHRNMPGDFEVTYMDGQRVDWDVYLARSSEVAKLGW